MPNLQTRILSRQRSIPMYSYEHAIILGVGGIGSWVALNLALSGKVTNLYLVDPDEIEESNLNRTPFRICDVGYPKVDALKYLILERRSMNVVTFKQRTNSELFQDLATRAELSSEILDCPDRVVERCVIIDCRDDVFEDFYKMPCKYYKIGYDGVEVTIDGNPRNTAVWGQADHYQVTPSFICPAQLAANMVVTDILVKDPDNIIDDFDYITNQDPFDVRTRINTVVTFNTKNLLELLYRQSLEEEQQDDS